MNKCQADIESSKVTASDFVADCTHPVLWMVSVGCPTGQEVALSDDVLWGGLPFDLAEIEGTVEEDGAFEASNLNDGSFPRGWRFSDWRQNTVTRLRIYSDQTTWSEQVDEAIDEGEGEGDE